MDNSTVAGAIIIIALVALFFPEEVGSAAGKVVVAFMAETTQDAVPVTKVPPP